MVRVLLVAIALIALIVQVDSDSMPWRMIMAKPGDRVEIGYYNPKNITRFVKNAKGVGQEHVFRVCNGKNKTKCGFWENVKTKKKVEPKTTYNKKKNLLIIQKVSALDAGTYRTPEYDTVDLYIQTD
ncbi:TransThyretin-Related family domain [Caenorhabditis elegans]|uniref:TransThyretin-Related family domain n=1 Tax=Caenorhabditis elegans TaxID=6239 RepID=Q9N4E4_CAEEL|nr:TransThyretin-Related family domain [Caenorhabditis elegans]CCD62341.1 TransThyretin-Related family domain [Caenorhabditis elegans]|eukprot:NP_501032.1 Uncharacterized protein CELE_Y73B6A.3 [Caenorhabditis elegans]